MSCFAVFGYSRGTELARDSLGGFEQVAFRFRRMNDADIMRLFIAANGQNSIVTEVMKMEEDQSTEHQS